MEWLYYVMMVTGGAIIVAVIVGILAALVESLRDNCRSYLRHRRYLREEAIRRQVGQEMLAVAWWFKDHPPSHLLLTCYGEHLVGDPRAPLPVFVTRQRWLTAMAAEEQAETAPAGEERVTPPTDEEPDVEQFPEVL